MSDRKTGILLHISSLSGNEGIGTLGKPAFKCVDLLHDAGVMLWQILPLGPTGMGNSPYNSFSAFAGNPLFIDTELMSEFYSFRGRLVFADNDLTAEVDYNDVYQRKQTFFKEVFQHVKDLLSNNCSFKEFAEKEKYWLSDYSLFMSIKEKNKNISLEEWEPELRLRKEIKIKLMKEKLREEMLFHSFLQFEFDRQWNLLRDYARKKEVEIMGDIPVYVAYDSADVWSHPELFSLDEDVYRLKVSGVPPDYFSEEGQLWGNPVYNWEKNKSENYTWWKQRLNKNLTMFDYLRIDHFRGFSEFWAVDAGEENAIKGQWEKGPGIEFFRNVLTAPQFKQIIAEDLGVLSDDVYEMIRELGFPGMRVLQFAFDEGKLNPHKPFMQTANSLVYTGTHDNDTLAGWIDALDEEKGNYVAEYLGCTATELHWQMIRVAMSSVSDLCVIPIQDILELKTYARMNTPGTVSNNWLWRMIPTDVENIGFEKLKRFVYLYER